MNRSYMNSALAKLVLAMATGVDKRRARRLYRRARKSARDKAAIQLGVKRAQVGCSSDMFKRVAGDGTYVADTSYLDILTLYSSLSSPFFPFALDSSGAIDPDDYAKTLKFNDTINWHFTSLDGTYHYITNNALIGKI